MVHRSARLGAAVLACFHAATPRQAEAFELSGGVGFGGAMVGSEPRPAVSPFAGISWGTDGGLLFAVRDVFSILPANHAHALGVYNQTAFTLGYAFSNASISAGPSLAVYAMSACGETLCGRVNGVAVGGQAKLDLYLLGPFGLSANASAHWIGGSSLVLPGGLTAMILVGPVVRWGGK